MLREQSRSRRATRWYPERASLRLVVTELLHFRFVLSDPRADLLAREFARCRRRAGLGPKSLRKKEKQFLFLADRQCISRSFDLGKRTHVYSISSVPVPD